MASKRWEEATLPLAAPRRDRVAKRRATLTTDSYIVVVSNPRNRPLPALLEDNGYESPEGSDVLALLEALGYDAQIELEGDDD